MSHVALEEGQRPAERTGAIRDGPRCFRRSERPAEVVPMVLECLGDLDPRDAGHSSPLGGDRLPGREGVGLPAGTAEETRAFYSGAFERGEQAVVATTRGEVTWGLCPRRRDGLCWSRMEGQCRPGREGQCRQHWSLGQTASLDDDIEALESFLDPPLHSVGAGEPEQIARMQLRASGGLAQALVGDGKEARERPHVLVVVARHIEEAVGDARPQVREVPPGDLPSFEIAVPVEPEELALHGSQPPVLQAMAEHSSHEGEQIEVAGVGGWRAALEPEPGDEEGPVEPAPVVRDEPGARRHEACERAEEGRLVRVVGKDELDLAEPARIPTSPGPRERRRSRPRCRGRWSRCPGRAGARPGVVRPADGRAGGGR